MWISSSPTLRIQIPAFRRRRDLASIAWSMLHALHEEITTLDAETAARAKRDGAAKRLMTVPGVGPVIATALEALAPPPEMFKSGRDFAAWIGLTPLQKSTGGKQRIGRTSRMGERTLRRLFIIACSGVVRWAKRKGAPAGLLAGADACPQAAHASDRGVG
jgi:transposase